MLRSVSNLLLLSRHSSASMEAYGDTQVSLAPSRPGIMIPQQYTPLDNRYVRPKVPKPVANKPTEAEFYV